MKTYFHWDDTIKKITRGEWILLMPYRLVDNFWISIFDKQMVRGKAYRQRISQTVLYIFRVKSSQRETSFMTESKFTYSTKCTAWISKRSRNAVEDRETFFRSYISESASPMLWKNNTHFLFLKEYLARVEIIGTYVLDKLPNEFFKTFNWKMAKRS